MIGSLFEGIEQFVVVIENHIIPIDNYMKCTEHYQITTIRSVRHAIDCQK